MLGRRFLLLVAVLMGLTALAASVAPREPADRGNAGSAATPTAPAGEAKQLESVSKRLNTAEGVTRVVVDEGDLVDLEVSGSELDTVSLLDEIVAIDPDSPAIFQLLADEPGEYPIELVEAERRVGMLVVREAD
jgi:hypothetical protein